MPVLVFAYLALGVVAQCALWTADPDWLDPTTWGHVLLWPGFAADRAAAALSGVRWLWVALAALLLMPGAAVLLAWRAGRVGRASRLGGRSGALPARQRFSKE